MTALEPGAIIDDAPEAISAPTSFLEPGVVAEMVEDEEKPAPERICIFLPQEQNADNKKIASDRKDRHVPILLGAGLLLLAIIAYDVTATVSEALVRHWVFGVAIAVIACGVTLLAAAWVFFEISSLSKLRQAGAIRQNLLTSMEAGDPTAFIRLVEISISGIANDEMLHSFRKTVSIERDCARIAFFVERDVLRTADEKAVASIAKASREVGLGSAFAPTPFISALVLILRCVAMVRSVATAYGYRPRIASTWLLASQILTGAALAASLDALSEGVAELSGEFIEEIELPIIGKVAGKVVGKIMGKTGEGVFAARRTARIGVAAMELCRPLPFSPTIPCPKLSQVLTAAFSG